MKVVTLALLVVVLAVGPMACGVNPEPGESQKIGQVTSLHRIGMFCKTWEMQIQRGGFTQGSGVTGAPFNVTIESDSLVAKARAYMEANREVEITYQTEGLYWPCRSGSGGDFLKSIHPLDTLKR